MSQKKRQIAVIAAVLRHIRAQEEQQMALGTLSPLAPRAGAPSFYAAYGRQQMMEMRRLLSLRMVRR